MLGFIGAMAFLLIVLGVYQIINYRPNNMDTDYVITGCVNIIFGIVMIGLSLGVDNCPKAMDVYQHKTTLRKTIVEGVVVDSVVVFKNKQ